MGMGRGVFWGGHYTNEVFQTNYTDIEGYETKTTKQYNKPISETNEKMQIR